MQIKVAKSAGFCFGVKRAVGIAESYAEKKIPAVTLDEIIHNPVVVEDLRSRGVFPMLIFTSAGNSILIVTLFRFFASIISKNLLKIFLSHF